MPSKPKTVTATQAEEMDISAEDIMDSEEVDDLSDLAEDESAELESEDSTSSKNDDEAAFLASLDDEVDAEAVAKKEAEQYLPKGLYSWKMVADKSPVVSPRYLSNDKRSSDRTTKGREIWDISGIAVHNETKKERFFRFSFSPDSRAMASGPRAGEPDGFSQTYSKVTAYYRKKFGETHKSHKALYAFLVSGDYAFYLTQSQGGNFLGQFQDKKK